MRGSQAQQCASFSPLPLQCTTSLLQNPLLFLEEWVWLPLHSCHAESVGGAEGIFFKCGICAGLTARLIEGTVRIPAEHSIKPISTELRKICTMGSNGFWTAVLVYNVLTLLLK